MGSKGDRHQRRADRKAEKLAKQQQRERQVRQATNPEPRKLVPGMRLDGDANTHSVLWSFRFFDDHDWRRDAEPLRHSAFVDVAASMRSYAQRTWGEILGDPNRDHPCEVGSLSREAQDRLVELKFDDQDEMYRFRFTGTQRLWGFREGVHFIVIWWDPDHQVYPAPLRNT